MSFKISKSNNRVNLQPKNNAGSTQQTIDKKLMSKSAIVNGLDLLKNILEKSEKTLSSQTQKPRKLRGFLVFCIGCFTTLPLSGFRTPQFS